MPPETGPREQSAQEGGHVHWCSKLVHEGEPAHVLRIPHPTRVLPRYHTGDFRLSVFPAGDWSGFDLTLLPFLSKCPVPLHFGGVWLFVCFFVCWLYSSKLGLLSNAEPFKVLESLG